MNPDDIETAFIREFSRIGNLVGRTKSRSDRRERIRQAIYMEWLVDDMFQDQKITYAEAFQICYGERLDRRVAEGEPGFSVQQPKGNRK